MVLLNLVAMVLAYVIASRFDISVGTYIDIMFKIFDFYYVIEVFAKLGAYVFFADNKWKYLKNKVFMMEVSIGIFHLFDLIFWQPIGTTRILRLFFVLRILTLFDSIRKFTVYIIQSLPALFLIVACFFTIFFGYSVMSMELFGTANTYRCRYSLVTRTSSEPYNSTYWPIHADYQYFYCGNDGSCPQGSTCGSLFDFSGYVEQLPTNSDLNYGITSFDNVVTAFITNFIIMTQDQWSKIMYMVIAVDIVLAQSEHDRVFCLFRLQSDRHQPAVAPSHPRNDSQELLSKQRRRTVQRKHKESHQ